ncbi:META domain-containing protein [Paeniglutamicibacter cryotolerans]|uniref:Heat shock protein HslJ n=1 Tax=Paeniglutamicibacter cryotolerans TaxID=670079 RepID=A0A839QEU7_9MICC|nr:META domain-containing protein [Paeniglutamicibacter cryotolerans]MBB2994430.1 heat shock protein HslJ [Paeniglutamicibacter cryotolerans]
MRRTQLLGAIAAALLLSSCAANGSTAATPIGTWGEQGQGQPQLVIEDGGQVSGTDGCNRLMGSWEDSGGVIAFGTLAGTRMMCEEVDVWLGDAASATVDNDRLVIEDASGAMIGTLQRGH